MTEVMEAAAEEMEADLLTFDETDKTQPMKPSKRNPGKSTKSKPHDSKQPPCLSHSSPGSDRTTAVTIISPSYQSVGAEAVRRMKKFSGLNVRVIECSDEEGFETKLNLDMIMDRKKFLFFDSDYWLLRKLPLDSWDGSSWLAVNDPGVFAPYAFPFSDCKREGMDRAKYWNSGFFCCDTRRPEHRAVFQEARALRKRVMSGTARKPDDFGDQYYLNMACQTLGTPMTLLPFVFNFYRHMISGGCFPFIPAEVIGLHAAGVPVRAKRPGHEDKLTHLTYMSKALTYPTITYQDDAMRWAWARNYQLA